MTDIKSRLVDALHTIVDEYQAGNITLTEGAGVLLSLPDVITIDLNDVDELAKVAARNWPDNDAKSWPWEKIPGRAREAYRQRVREALLAAAGRTPESTHPDCPSCECGEQDRHRLLPQDAEGLARDIDFCIEAAHYATARHQLRRLIELLSRP